MAVLQDIDELLRAHQAIREPGPGAPPIENGARVGSALLRSTTLMISAMVQTSVEETFKQALRREFETYNDTQLEHYWKEVNRTSGNPSPNNIEKMFFRIGFPKVLDGLSWKKRNNNSVRQTLDRINQVRNRIAHGQPLAIDGFTIRLNRPMIVGWRNFAEQFCKRFDAHVMSEYDE